MIVFSDIRENEKIRIYIEKADRSLMALGYTEHSFAHVTRVAEEAGRILTELGYDDRTAELARIAGFLHDIGNLVNRVDHSQSGAVMAFRILDNLNMDSAEIAEIVTAIGNHDEGTGVPVSELAAALILADKSDVRSSRVRNDDPVTFDIHDRVNHSVRSSALEIDREEGVVLLNLAIDTSESSVMEYFEIFLSRMILCRKAAEKLGMCFALEINGQRLL